MTAAEKVAVVGAGTMGTGIAEVFAARGYRVSLYSRTVGTLDAARRHLATFASAVAFTSSLDTCLDGAAFVSENVAEDLTLKRDVFARIEASVSEHCLLTTNTSSVPIGAIAASMRQPRRLIGMHWFNPPTVMPLIELVRGPDTDDAVVTRTRDLAIAIGKESIEVQTDLPGFVVNRLQYALLREALHLLESGAATVAEVDRAVETTLAPRWSSAGPLKLMDLAGLDTVAKVAAILMPALCRDTAVPATIARLAAEGAFGTKAGRGFYTWSEDEAAKAKHDRDETVRLLTGRRAPGAPSAG